MTAPALALAGEPSPRSLARRLLSMARRWLLVQWTFLVVVLLWGADKTGLRRLGWWLARRSGRPEPITRPAALRIAFERLGPTYLKLGQMIGSSDGLFPKRYSEEFRKCLDRVPSFPTPAVYEAIQQELGRPHGELFARFDELPVAAASIAQVHLAVRLTGEPVAVKVQRPGIAERVRDDIAIMRLYARVLSAVVPFLELANLVGIVEDLGKTLGEELDFCREARNMDEFNDIMAQSANTRVVAPRVHWDLTRARVLTMERFVGTRVDDYEAIAAGPHDGEAMLLAGIRGWFQCLLLRGFFHGDVHAGNFMLLDDGRVGFLDFGIIGRFDGAQKLMIADFVLSFQSRNFARLATTLVSMGSVDRARLDLERFTKDLGSVLGAVADGADAFKDMIPAMLRVAVKHRMRMPREFVLVTKQLVYLDRYARAIGGANMSVLTDTRVMGFLLEDLARFG